MLSIIISIYFLTFFVRSNANSDSNINIQYRGNETVILFYNLTTNSSYYITFRSFGNEQSKFGLFSPTKGFEEYSIEIPCSYSTIDLLIICFHFLHSNNDLDIQCHDRRILKSDKIFLPSYNPLFVPMMYGLSILMLLPVIIQNHRRKKALVLQRRKELRRLSVSISRDKQNPKRNIVQKLLAQIMEDGKINYKNIPIDIELVSVPSTKTILDDLEDNPHVTWRLSNLQSFVHQYEENDSTDELEIDAHDCIAHLLDQSPWNTPNTDQPLITNLWRHSAIRDCPTPIKELNVPTIITLHDDRKSISKSKKYPSDNFYSINRAFLESDV